MRQKCERCGWKYPVFHICIENASTRVETPRTNPSARRKSQSHKDAISEGQSARWERYREENAARDDKIIELYQEGGVGHIDIAQAVGLSKSTVQKVLKQASRDGLVELRPPGTTLAKGAK